MAVNHRARALVPLLAAFVLVAAGACKKSEASGPLADVTVGEHGFTPTSLKLPAGGAGSHTSVSFVRTTDKTCATEVVFPELHIDLKLPLNQVVNVDLPTDKPQTLGFQCGMGMYKGAVVVASK
ncbi:MAG TPA: cupredoxin domain-containing protein [Polyangiaceae bacterium]